MSGTERMSAQAYRVAVGVEAPPPAPLKEAKRSRRRTEDALQRQIVQWLELQGASRLRDYRVFHPANGGGRSRIEAALFQGLGVRAGVPDLVITWADKIGGEPVSRVAYMEVKAPAGTLTASQNEWRAWCLARRIPHAVARSLDDAIAAVRAWGLVR